MADNNSEEGRKSARGRRASKRDEDVLEPIIEEGKEAEEPKEIPKAKRKAKPRKTTANKEAKAGEEPEAAEEPKAAKKPRAAKKSKGAEEPEAATPSQKRQGSDVLSDEAVIKTGEQWMSELFTRMKLDLEASGTYASDTYTFNISGPDTDALVGRSRQSPRVLSAIQTILTEKLGSDVMGKVVVDLGGFKQQRQAKLNDIAVRLGQTAKDIDRTLVVAGLNSFERRIIHRRLDSLDGIETESVDHGIFRKLQVQPK